MPPRMLSSTRSDEAPLVVARDGRARRGRRGTARCPSSGSAGARGSALGTGGGCGARGRCGTSQAARELDDRVVVQRAGGRDDDVARARSARRGSRAGRRRCVLAMTSARPITGAAERMVAEDRLAEHVEDAGPAGRPRTSRSPRARSRARWRGPRRRCAGARPCRRRRRTPARGGRRSRGRRPRSISLPVPAFSSAPIVSKIWSISSEP